MFTTLCNKTLLVCLFLTLLLWMGSSAAAQSSDRFDQLSFEQRVSYQKAIEEVYWQHRIWPKDNKTSKPSLRQVMPDSIVRAKVQDYLKKSVALADYFDSPIRPEHLQAEIERMRKNTKRPDVLQELFLALANDPYVIAECLARPAFANREIRRRQSEDRQFQRWWTDHSEYLGVEIPNSGHAYSLSASSLVSSCTDDTWTATNTDNAPEARTWTEAVWTGSEMIIWGGQGPGGFYQTGRRYDPATDTWTDTNVDASTPTGRWWFDPVWTGTEVIVWGGWNGPELDSGARYNPTTNSWVSITLVGAPEARYEHRAVWTGTEMVVWGGSRNSGAIGTGGRYTPSTDSWAPMSASILAPRLHHTAVWTGSEAIFWGGHTTPQAFFKDGAKYNPVTDNWTAISDAPFASAADVAVWTGTEMIFWGGYDFTWLNRGARYNPATDSWIETNAVGAPAGRGAHQTIWTGSEVIVWGGEGGPGCCYHNTGGRYNPSTDSWRLTSIQNVPDARQAFAAVWTGNEMIVWGGERNNPRVVYGSGGRYCAAPPPYDFSGFFPPVDNPPVFNVAKAGSSVPIKFSLNGDQGLDILASNSPSSRYVDCVSTTLDPIEETASSTSGLHYDPDADQYIYVWKTNSNWASKCREFRLILTDGTEHPAYFKFK